MTPSERADPAIIDGARRVRIARGSGTATSDVNALLKQFKEMQKMMKGFGKGGMAGAMGGLGGLLGRGPKLSPEAMAEMTAGADFSDLAGVGADAGGFGPSPGPADGQGGAEAGARPSPGARAARRARVAGG